MKSPVTFMSYWTWHCFAHPLFTTIRSPLHQDRVVHLCGGGGRGGYRSVLRRLQEGRERDHKGGGGRRLGGGAVASVVCHYFYLRPAVRLSTTFSTWVNN